MAAGNLHPDARPVGSIGAFRLSWNFLQRDFSAGELHLLLLALILAVSAIATVGFLVDRLNRSLAGQAAQLLGADLVLVSDRPVPPAWTDQAASFGLASAQSIAFASMAMNSAGPGLAEQARPAPQRPGQARGDAAALSGGAGQPDAAALPLTQLVSVMAVSANHPLRGALTLAVGPAGAHEQQGQGPAPGTVWADPVLASRLGLAIGQHLELGNSRFLLAGLIVQDPARGSAFLDFAPRLVMSLQDLPATGLTGPGSRLTYRLLVAGRHTQVADFKAWLQPRLAAGQRLESIESGQPALQSTLKLADRFMALVSLLSALIAAVAIGLAARRFAERHLDGFAVLKVLGIGQSLLARALVLEMLWLAAGGGLLAVLLGWGAHQLLIGLLGSLLPGHLPAPSGWPALQALLVALVLVSGFAAVPVMRLANVTPLRVLRRELGQPGLSAWLVMLAAFLAFAVLMRWQLGETRLAVLAMAGFMVSGLVMVLLAAVLVRLSARLGPRQAGGPMKLALRLALSGWSRRLMLSVTQIVALAIGLMAMLLLTVVHNDLLGSWQDAVPANAPNRFVVNIQPEQAGRFRRFLHESGVADVRLYPAVRARLVAINEQPVDLQRLGGERARRLLDRELNLSYGTTMPAHNQLAAGRWIRPDAAEISLEAEVMKTLGLSIGDRLGFDVAGQRVEATVVGSRNLQWNSMQVNFFMITSPRVLAAQPQSLITAFYLPDGEEQLVPVLLAAMPNLTVIDTRPIIARIKLIVDQVVQAVQYLFLFTMLAGLVVLYAAMASVRDERAAEVALMRALGASRRQLLSAQLLELSLTGLLAGLLAAAGAAGTGWLLASQVFRLPYQPDGWLLLVGAGTGTAFVILAAGWRLWRLIGTPPLRALRAL